MTPIERAARALVEQPDVRFTRDPEHPTKQPEPIVRERHPLVWDVLPDEAKDLYRNQVRAVLTAIREPSEGMFSNRRGPHLRAREEYFFDDQQDANGMVRAIWQAMIDKALEEG